MRETVAVGRRGENRASVWDSSFDDEATIVSMTKCEEGEREREKRTG